MSRNLSASPSEGEILESDSEKANKSINGSKDTTVDRPSRTRVTISRSPSPYRASGRQSRDLSRDRSRSPYREAKGAKRRHEDDHYDRTRNDPRRFKVRYEESGLGRGYKRKDFHREADRLDRGSRKYNRSENRFPPDQPRDKRELGSYQDRPSAYSNGRRREAEGFDGKNGRKSGHSWQSHEERDHQEGRVKFTNEQSVSDQGPGLIAAAQSRHHAETDNAQTSNNRSAERSENGGISTNSVLRQADGTDEATASHSGTQLDEAALIEERRKRREAIKARHKGQATPLLVQALAIDKTSEPNTPKGENSEIQCGSSRPPTRTVFDTPNLASPNPPNPISPKDISGQHSPSDFTVAKDTDLANSNAVSDAPRPEEEPSAADYDPTMDMQEDRLRHDQHQQQETVSASAYDETKQADQDVIVPQAAVEQSAKDGSGEAFDMFSEDVDMFADAPATSKGPERTASKAVPVPKAQARDMSMLDDWDDPEGYYKVILGELFDSRYHVQSNLGKGMFSGVVRATDQITKQLVAIKIVRNNETMKKAGLKEIEILQTLSSADPEDKKHLIRLERFFEHKGHLCMVFENLSINLREVLKKFGRDIGINLKAVRAYAQQMFLGLSLMRKCSIIHADLKPDNVLVNESRNGLKICDLGSASDTSENEITQYLVSRFYRAPEIILGLPYDFAIDMWSVGCTLYELYTGKILFTGKSNNQMLKVMMECRGKFSQKMLRKAQFASYHFDEMLNFRSVERDKLTGRDTVKVLNFVKPERDLRTRLLANVKGMNDSEIKEVTLFVDLLDRCLNLNPEKRCTPAEALKHPFIMRQKV